MPWHIIKRWADRYFGGMEDLDRHLIRCVGDAEERFSEDALRILRGVRFAAQLGFDIENGTKKGCAGWLIHCITLVRSGYRLSLSKR